MFGSPLYFAIPFCMSCSVYANFCCVVMCDAASGRRWCKVGDGHCIGNVR